MNTRIITCPFALFGNPGTQLGAELLTDALLEMQDDNSQEDRPTRAAAYRDHVDMFELPNESVEDIAQWRERSEVAAREAFTESQFLIWLGGNHLSAMPVYQELAKFDETVIVQFDAHLDVYNLSDCTETLSHGNFIRYLDPLPAIINVGHRDLFLPDKEVGQWFKAAYSATSLHLDFEQALKSLRKQTAGAKRVFLDLDCDFFDPAYFPAVAQSQTFGLSPAQLLRLIDSVWGPNVVGMSISEFDAARDVGDRSLETIIWLIEHILLKRYERKTTSRRRI